MVSHLIFRSAFLNAVKHFNDLEKTLSNLGGSRKRKESNIKYLRACLLIGIVSQSPNTIKRENLKKF